MCKWGTYEEVECTIVAGLSYTGKERRKLVKVDKCIAHIVRALSQAGITMVDSCCGHGKKNTHARIVLEEGLILNIEKKPNFGTYEFTKSEEATE